MTRRLGNPLLDAAYAAYRWVSPVIDPLRVARGLMAYPRYLSDMARYRRMAQAEPMRLIDAFPALHDRTATSPYDAHYFYQDIWAFRRVLAAGVTEHVDVASRIEFAGFLSTCVPVTFIDLRPLEVQLPNFESRRGDILALPYEDQSLRSLSCLNVAEHIGLGRYGDALDPDGTRRACRELARVLAPGGRLYFSGPVGKPRLCFNGHRIHAPSQVTLYFPDLDLVEFSAVTDEGDFVEHVTPAEFDSADYSCGLFVFTRPSARTP